MNREAAVNINVDLKEVGESQEIGDVVSTTTKHASRAQQIDADKILIIHSNTPVTLLGNLFGCLPLTVILWDDEKSLLLLAWLAAIYTFTFFRWKHYQSLNTADASLSEIFKQGRTYITIALVSGSIWGVAGIVFFDPLGLEENTFLILTLITITGASMTSFASKPLTYTAFVIPTIVPLIVTMLVQNVDYYFWVAMGTCLFLLVSFSYSRNLHEAINSTLVLKYENMDLVENLEEQTNAANKANKDKSRFLAAASHDLRQPLHAVNLFIETLGAKLETDEQKHDLFRINGGLESLGELLNGLLDISRLDSESASIGRRNFNLEELVQKLVDQYAIEANSKGLKLSKKGCSHVVFSDPLLLEQIIRNTISNAIRYTEKGSIELSCSTSDPNKVRLYVTDTGIGIADSEKENVFGEFFQLHNPERDRNKGLGLGLAIVHRIAGLLDHRIHLSSEPGVGTEFSVELPLGQLIEETDAPPSLVVKKSNLVGLKILVVDNEVDILDAMKNLLESWGTYVTCAKSVTDALELINDDYRPDLILTDYRMPGELNGRELVQQLQYKLGDLPALILTGDTGVEVIEEIRAADLYLIHKPIKPAQLRLAVTRLSQNLSTS